MQNKQWILIVVAVGLISLLFFFGKTIQKSDSKETTTKAEVQEVDFKSIEQLFISQSNLPDSIINVLQKFKDNEKDTASLLNLALAYRDLHQPHLAGYYFEQLAKANNSAHYYERAGNAFLNGYRNNIDSNILNNLLTFAIQSFEKAIDLEPNNVAAKINLGTVYVESGSEPMKGIGILREIVDEDPNNIEVIVLLGRFSLQSGQYDKAKERLEGALKIDPNNAEAMYFLAFTEAELGNKARALQLIENCKILVGNPEFDKEIEHFIKELKK